MKGKLFLALASAIAVLFNSACIPRPEKVPVGDERVSGGLVASSTPSPTPAPTATRRPREREVVEVEKPQVREITILTPRTAEVVTPKPKRVRPAQPRSANEPLPAVRPLPETAKRERRVSSNQETPCAWNDMSKPGSFYDVYWPCRHIIIFAKDTGEKMKMFAFLYTDDGRNSISANQYVGALTRMQYGGDEKNPGRWQWFMDAEKQGDEETLVMAVSEAFAHVNLQGFEWKPKPSKFTNWPTRLKDLTKAARGIRGGE